VIQARDNSRQVADPVELVSLDDEQFDSLDLERLF
jgi:hypothetical protein